MNEPISTIALPARPQPDTIAAIFLLHRFGEARFPGVAAARVDVWQTIPPGETDESLEKKGVLLLDSGGGRFDHHNREKTTASDLVAGYLGIAEDPAIQKILEYARRDDFFGKGTVSNDPLDRAFGLSGLIANLNRKHPTDPQAVVSTTLPLLEAHYEEEYRRTNEHPKEVAEKLADRRAETFELHQHANTLKAIFIESDNVGLNGYLRSRNGGAYDVVAQRQSTGHVNILTRPLKRVQLTELAKFIRIEELAVRTAPLPSTETLRKTGSIPEVPEWYYDPATNSLLNGGAHPKSIPPTQLSREKLIALMKKGLDTRILPS